MSEALDRAKEAMARATEHAQDTPEGQAAIAEAADRMRALTEDEQLQMLSFGLELAFAAGTGDDEGESESCSPR